MTGRCGIIPPAYAASLASSLRTVHMGDSPTQSKVFISYSRKDQRRVRVVAHILKAAKVEAFIDVEDIPFGAQWKTTLDTAISGSGVMLLFWSKYAAKSENVKEEYTQALQSHSVRIVPVMLDGTQLPGELSQFQAVDAAGITPAHINLRTASLVVVLMLFSLTAYRSFMVKPGYVAESRHNNAASAMPPENDVATSLTPTPEATLMGKRRNVNVNTSPTPSPSATPTPYPTVMATPAPAKLGNRWLSASGPSIVLIGSLALLILFPLVLINYQRRKRKRALIDQFHKLFPKA